MSIIIGHARISENGTVNGKAGDQTGREVEMSPWYDNKWLFMLRPMTTTQAEKSAICCEKICRNSNVGYDQLGAVNRNTLRAEILKVGYDNAERIKTPCNCDCSSLMHVCAEAGGAKIPVYSGNCQTTATMEKDFPASGAYAIFRDDKYLRSDKNLKRGDILVSSGHTAMALENGADAEHEGKIKMIVNGRECWVQGTYKSGTNTISGTVREIFGAMGAEISNNGSTPIIKIK